MLRGFRGDRSSAELARQLGLEGPGVLDEFEAGTRAIDSGLVDVIKKAIGLSDGETAALRQAIESDRVARLYDKPSPFLGLDAYAESQSNVFWGREDQIRECAGCIEVGGFVVVSGSSGSGKSSFLRAGLIPLFRKRDMLILYMTPGTGAWESLARSIRNLSDARMANAIGASTTAIEEVLKDGIVRALTHFETEPGRPRQVLLVIDQFEQLLSGPQGDLHEGFLPAVAELLAHPPFGVSRSVHLAIGIRQDCQTMLTQHPAIIERSVEFHAQLRILDPLAPENLKRAVSGLAQREGIAIPQGLLDQMITDAGTTTAVMPLVQQCLTRLWKERSLDLEGYDRLGGVAGAMASEGDEIYQRASPNHRSAMREVLFQLVYMGSAGDDPDRARVVRYDELVEVPGVGVSSERVDVVRGLIDARLLVRETTSDEAEGEIDNVRLVHESLVSHWGLLKVWLDEDRSQLLVLQEVHEAAEKWKASTPTERSAWCIAGAQLREATSVVKRFPIRVRDVDWKFLAACRAKEEFEFEDRIARLGALDADAAAVVVQEVRRRLAEGVEVRAGSAASGADPRMAWRWSWVLAPSHDDAASDLVDACLVIGPDDLRVVLDDLSAFPHLVNLLVDRSNRSLDAATTTGARSLRAVAILTRLVPDQPLPDGLLERALGALLGLDPRSLVGWTRWLGATAGVREVLCHWLGHETISEAEAWAASSVLTQVAETAEDWATALVLSPVPARSGVIELISSDGGRREAVLGALREIQRLGVPGDSDPDRVACGRQIGAAALGELALTLDFERSAASVLVDGSVEVISSFLATATKVLGSERTDQVARWMVEHRPPVDPLGVLLLGEASSQPLDRALTDLLERRFIEHAAGSIRGPILWLASVRGQDGMVDRLLRSITIPFTELVGLIRDHAGDDAQLHATELIPGTVMPFVVVPSGTFVMGSGAERSKSRPDESPPHRVRITAPFAIAAREILKVEFGAFEASLERPVLPSTDEWSEHLVVGPTWYEAVDLGNWLNGQLRSTADPDGSTRYCLRLPAEAEWEYSARAGTDSMFSFGSDHRLLDRYGWTEPNADLHAHPPFQLRPNPWGAFDMHGNLWEWCLDTWATYPADDTTPVDNPYCVDDSPYRVLRGGTWNLAWYYARSAQRNHHYPTNRNWYNGVRLVIGPEREVVNDREQCELCGTYHLRTAPNP
jgi:formylglycine-generating enzyme required for sulfatase activity